MRERHDSLYIYKYINWILKIGFQKDTIARQLVAAMAGGHGGGVAVY
jgi:hypothetical protein